MDNTLSAQVAKLEAERDALRNAIQRLAESVTGKSHDGDEWADMMDAVRDQLGDDDDTLLARADELTEQLDGYRASLENARVYQNGMEVTICELRNTVDELTAERDALRDELDCIRKGTPVDIPRWWKFPIRSDFHAIYSNETKITYSMSDVANILNDYAAQVERTRLAEARVSELEVEIASCNQDADSAADARVAELETETWTMAGKLAELEAALATAQRDGARAVWHELGFVGRACVSGRYVKDSRDTAVHCCYDPEGAERKAKAINTLLQYPEPEPLDPERLVYINTGAGLLRDGRGCPWLMDCATAKAITDASGLLDWTIEEIDP